MLDLVCAAFCAVISRFWSSNNDIQLGLASVYGFATVRSFWEPFFITSSRKEFLKFTGYKCSNPS